MRRFFVVFAIFSLSAIFLPSFALGATKTVCSSGCDYTTIQGALNYAALAGDDIVSVIGAGTYTEQLQLKRSGSLGHPIYLRNDSGGTVLIRNSTSPVLDLNTQSYWYISGFNWEYNGSQTDPRVVDGYSGNKDYITFTGNTVTMSSGTAGDLAIFRSGDHLIITNNTFEVTGNTATVFGVSCSFNSNLEFSGNTLAGNYLMHDGIMITGTNLNIENNNVWGGSTAGGAHPDGIVVQGDGDRYGNHTNNVRVHRNMVYDFNQNIYLDAVANTFTGVYVYNNLIYATGHLLGGGSSDVHGIIVHGERVPAGATNAWDIESYVYNNTINVPGLALRLLQVTGTSPRKFENNLIARRSTGGCDFVSPGLTVDYNCHISTGNTPFRLNGTLYTFEQFVNNGYGESHGVSAPDLGLNSDYSLKPTSPCKDVGLNLSSVFTIDKNGIPRPQGSAWDIGAYEGSTGAIRAPSNLRIISP